MDQLSITSSSGATKVVFEENLAEENPISKNSVGTTKTKDLTRLVGLLMSKGERWLVEERLYAITGVGILFSFGALIFLLAFSLGIKWDRYRNEIIKVGGRNYYLTGLAQVDNNGKKVYLPAYVEGR